MTRFVLGQTDGRNGRQCKGHSGRTSIVRLRRVPVQEILRDDLAFNMCRVVDWHGTLRTAYGTSKAAVMHLTRQQARILQLICEGRLNKQIAYDLDVSEATIKAHMTAIFRKLGVRNRTQAVLALKDLAIEPQGMESN